MAAHKVVSRADWIAARKKFLIKEKEFTRAGDALSRQLRDLPWVRVDKEYIFEGPDGAQSFAELFDGRNQLITYHFMFGPDWEEGCPSCSYLADHFERAIIHLNQRDVTMVAVSRAPLEKLLAYKKRLGWNFKWLSSLENDFNFDYHVSFLPEERENGQVYYNYRHGSFPSDEAPGLSVFYKDGDGGIYHTYSSYGRGLDHLIGAYHYLDMVPKGRDEDDLSFPMAWVRRNDSY